MLRGVFGDRSIASQHLLTIAIHHFVGNERERAVLAGGDDAVSVHSGLSTMSTRTDRTRFLPHSRLKRALSIANMASSQSPLDTARRDSMRRTQQQPDLEAEKPAGFRGSTQPAPTALDADLQQRFRALARLKASEVARQFQRIDDPALPHTLLAMEQALLASTVDIDVISCTAAAEGEQEGSWATFESTLLGSRIDTDLLLQQGLQRAREAPGGDHGLCPASSKIAAMSLEEARRAQAHPLRDLLEKERNYTKQLCDLEHWFCQELGKRRIVGEYPMRTVFEPLARLARLHRALLGGLEAAEGDPEGMALALTGALREQRDFREAYQQYCNLQGVREQALKEETESNQSFSQFCEDVYKRRVFGLAKLDQLLMAPVQRITRYRLHLEEVVRSTHPQDDALPALREALHAATRLAAFVDAVVEQQRSLAALLSLQSRVRGLPSGFVSPTAKRFLATQLPVREEGSSGGSGGQAHCLYLLSDTLLLVRESDGSAGIGSSSSSSKKTKKNKHVIERAQLPSAPQHDLVIGAALLQTRLSATAHGLLELSFSLPEGHQCPMVPAGEHRRLFRLQPASPEAMRAFLADYTALRCGQESRLSPARIHLMAQTAPELRFHVFPSQEAYLDTVPSTRHRIALLFLENIAMPSVDSAAFEGLGALAVVQARGDSFRSSIRYRGLLYTSDACFAAQRDFGRPVDFRQPFLRALAACARLLDVYPPFSPEVLRQRQQQLQILEAGYSDSLKFRLKDSLSALAGRLRSKKKESDPDALAQRLWEGSMSSLAASIDDLSLGGGGGGGDEEQVHPEGDDDIPRSVNPFSLPLANKKKEKKKDRSRATESPLKTASPLAASYYDD